MSEELKPCPFCGDTPTGDAHTLTQGFKYGAIECGCGAIGPDVRTGYEDWPAWKEAAAKEWNERAELAALKAVAPYGYLREVDGNVQLSVGPTRPADRSGGCATPWAAIFAAPPASADAVSVPAAMPERWEVRLSRMHQTIQAGCWPKRWVDDAKDYELGELRALLARQDGKP